jgi:hypothetical protein
VVKRPTAGRAGENDVLPVPPTHHRPGPAVQVAEFDAVVPAHDRSRHGLNQVAWRAAAAADGGI